MIDSVGQGFLFQDCFGRNKLLKLEGLFLSIYSSFDSFKELIGSLYKNLYNQNDYRGF